VVDPAARLAMLRSGDLDVAEVPFKLKREADAAGLSFLRSDAAAIYHVHLGGQVLPSRESFDPAVPWVGDPNDAASQERARQVRQALDLAVDKQAIIGSVFEGEGVPVAYPWVVPGSEFIPPGMTPTAYDPARAKQLLAEAGYPNGFGHEIEMYLVPFPGRAEMVDVGEAVAGFWERNLGLQVRRIPAEWATFAPQKQRPRKMAWATWGYGAIPRPSAEPAITMSTWLTSKSPNNTIAEVPRIDDPDRAKRVQLYRELGQTIQDGHYVVSIAAVPALYAYNKGALASWPLAPGEAYIHGFEDAVPAR
jgi:ABC-type transport system substrate-binding protein